MINTYNKIKNQTYPEYKDSGIEWLGKIPEHWEVKRLKFLLSEPLKYGANESAEYDEPSWPRYLRITDIDKNGLLKKETFKSIPKEIAYPYLLKDGDILFARSRSIGRTFLYQKCYGQIAFAGYLIRVRLKIIGNIPKFIYYFCQSQVYWKWIKDNSIQSTIQNVSAEKYSNLFIPLPQIKEQKTIANFLDKETSCIDSLIQKKERQIELLKEKRLALITQAVSKGLNPNVKMKDSGIEWLGKIPEHWGIKKIKHYVIFIKNGTTISQVDYETPYKVTRIETISSGKINYDKIGYVEMSPVLKQFQLKKNDILLSHINSLEIVGNSAIFLEEEELYSGMNLLRIRTKPDVYPFYLLWYLKNKVFIYSIRSIAKPAVNQVSVTISDLKDIILPYTQIEEQKSITKFLDKETSQIDSLIEKIQKSINLLKEYRSALITSAVTGKIDVCKSQTKNIIPFQKSQSVKLIETKKTAFATKVNSKKRYSIQEKKSALAARKVSQKTENSLFKKAVLGAKIVSQLKDNPHFGRTKFMKTLYLCEAHLQIPLKGAYKRSAAGPLDNAIYKMEGIMKKNNWFEPVQKGSMYKYKALKNFEDYKPYFDKYWGNYREKLNQFLSFFERFTTEQSEIIDTIYAVWNDCLIEGRTPSDDEIVDEVKNNWHKSKKRFSAEKLKKAIQWMRDQKLIPIGYGSKTNR